MKRLDTLTSIEGRKTLYRIFKELRYEKQYSSITTIINCWRICMFETELQKYVKDEITVTHPLGFFKGTSLWMEEIINRHYFSTINSFVYFGAAILLALIGIRNFSDKVSDTMVIAGVAFEALMLLFIFIVMLFTPSNEIAIEEEREEVSELEEIVDEVGEISREFAAGVVQLENLNHHIKELNKSQHELSNKIGKISDAVSAAVTPNPELLNQMKAAAETLKEFSNSVENLNESLKKIKDETLKASIREELENFLARRLDSK